MLAKIIVTFVLSMTSIAYYSSVNNFVILLKYSFLYNFLVHSHVLCAVLYSSHDYLTIIPRVRMGSGSIAREAEGRMGYRAFSITWPASMLINWNKRKHLHEKRVKLPEDFLGTPTWPPFHCFGTPIWPP